MTFCYYKDDNDKENYPKWGWLDAAHRLLFGNARLNAFKDGFIIFHRDRIIHQALINEIPPELIAGVAFSEVGGKPDYFKLNVMEARMLIWSKINFLNIEHKQPYPEKTSIGSIAMQIETAAKTLDPATKPLSYTEQYELASCLLHDTYNINLAARILKKLILYDYPDCDTSHLTDEQFILAGSRAC